MCEWSKQSKSGGVGGGGQVRVESEGRGCWKSKLVGVGGGGEVRVEWGKSGWSGASQG